MTTALTKLDLSLAEEIAEDLPGHTEQLALYESAGLAPRDAFMLESHAARIRTLGRQGILQIGQELLSARERAQHGTWATFLARAGIEERSALNYMRVAEQFGDKPEVVKALPASTLYGMAAPSADPVVVGEIVEAVRAGAPPSPKEVQQRLGAAKAPPAERDANGKFMPTTPYVPPAQVAPQLTPLPMPTPVAAGDEEIAAPPAARPTPTPLVMTPLAPAAPAPTAPDRKLLAAKRALLVATLMLVEDDLAGSDGPTIVIHEAQIAQAARMFLVNPGFNAAAAMLAFSAREEAA